MSHCRLASGIALALALFGAADALAQLRGLGAPSPGIGGISGGGLGSPGGGIGGGGLGGGGLGGGSLPRSPDPIMPGAGTPGGGYPNIDGLYDRTTNSANDGLNRNPVTPIERQTTRTLGNDQLGKNVPAVRPATGPRASRVPPASERRFVATEVLVALPGNLSTETLDTLARRHRLTRRESHSIGLTGTTFHRWQIADQRSVAEVVRALEADAGVRVAQPNYRFTLQQDGPAKVHQYALAKLRLPEAHRLATGERVLVAVIDNGIDVAHPEFAGLIAGGFDATERPAPPSHHGTGMAGAIVAHYRLTGVAPAARILAIRAFSATGGGEEATTLSILRGIDWAVANGARVINMSFAGPPDPEIAASLAAAAKKGIVLVAAAGNAGPKSGPLYPAADPNVIAVTATDSEDRLYTHSNRGRHIAVAAPGVEIVVPAPSATYQVSTGTSVAAAQVSGIVALLLESKPGLTPQAVRKILLATAKDLGPKGHDDQFGAGLADAYRAVQSLTAPAGARTPVATAAPAR